MLGFVYYQFAVHNFLRSGREREGEEKRDSREGGGRRKLTKKVSIANHLNSISPVERCPR